MYKTVGVDKMLATGFRDNQKISGLNTWQDLCTLKTNTMYYCMFELNEPFTFFSFFAAFSFLNKPANLLSVYVFV